MVRLPGVGAGRVGSAGFGAWWFRDPSGVPESALHRGAHRVPTENTVARLHGRRRADRGVRRRAPFGGQHRGSSCFDETGHPRGRGRALLPAYRGRLPRSAPSSLLQLGERRQDSRGFDDHDAGRAKLFPLPGKDADPKIVRGPARVQDRKQPRQRSDPGDLHQPDLSRPEGLRVRRGGACTTSPCLTTSNTRRPKRLRSVSSAKRSWNTKFTPSSSPRWSVSYSMNAIRRMTTRAGFASTRRSRAPTRKQPTRPFARACSNTIGATAIAAPKDSST